MQTTPPVSSKMPVFYVNFRLFREISTFIPGFCYINGRPKYRIWWFDLCNNIVGWIMNFWVIKSRNVRIPCSYFVSSEHSFAHLSINFNASWFILNGISDGSRHLRPWRTMSQKHPKVALVRICRAMRGWNLTACVQVWAAAGPTCIGGASPRVQFASAERMSRRQTISSMHAISIVLHMELRDCLKLMFPHEIGSSTANLRSDPALVYSIQKKKNASCVCRT